MLDIPEQTVRNYKNTYLSRVVLQLRFSQVPTIGNSHDRIFEMFRDEYPLMDSPANLTPNIPLPSHGVARLASRDRCFLLELKPTALTFVSEDGYPGWGEFSRRARRIADRIWDEFDPPFISRVGFRYQDAIVKVGADSPTIWKEYLRTDLVSFTTSDVLAHSVLSSQHGMVLAHNDAAINLQWSTQTGTDGADTPAQRLDLDMDMFCEDVELGLDDGFDRLNTYHDVLIQLFEWLITDKWREEMGDG